ncbi:hypothetical protein LARV_00993 [Longilinea arvoryzae]|uniref:Uncharacterized protein n=1 Tax=Longilinea arvoryzae TaxID=360412 RepID=A0A0S7BI55_9CHLR|nr:hypothetical protein [Longilinea arvoryzae]GAP13242.1 hypothetical protein LARV_00993 [Longilinea arvoryzae]
MGKLPRATQIEIMEHLKALLGDEAVIVTSQVCELLIKGESQDALRVLKELDQSIGGIGVHCRKPDEKLPGVYRALTYVEMPLHKSDPTDAARGMIVAAGGYLEDLIARGLGPEFFMHILIDFKKAPLGAMVDLIRISIPSGLFDELKWFSGRVYNYAKHDFDSDNRSDPIGDHYFGLDEGIAIYFIARKLGEELITVSRVDHEKLVAIS